MNNYNQYFNQLGYNPSDFGSITSPGYPSPSGYNASSSTMNTSSVNNSTKKKAIIIVTVIIIIFLICVSVSISLYYYMKEDTQKTYDNDPDRATVDNSIESRHRGRLSLRRRTEDTEDIGTNVRTNNSSNHTVTSGRSGSSTNINKNLNSTRSDNINVSNNNSDVSRETSNVTRRGNTVTDISSSTHNQQSSGTTID